MAEKKKTAYDDPDVMRVLNEVHIKRTGKVGGVDDPEIMRTLDEVHAQRTQAESVAASGEDSSAWRYPRMGLQAINTGLATIPNAAITATNLLGWGMNKASGALGGPEIRPLGYIDPVMPDTTPQQGTWEPWATGAVSGGVSALEGGLLARAVGAGGKVISEGSKVTSPLVQGLPEEAKRLGAEVLHSGVVPGAVGAGAMDLAGQVGAGEGAKSLIGLGVGFLSGLLSHGMLGKNPVEAVATGLGKSKDADEVGTIAKAQVRNWQQAFDDKIEALKNTSDQPLSPDAPEVFVPKMFGKVDLKGESSNASETLARARELASKGGIFKSWFTRFRSSLPEGMQQEIENIAERNNPIKMATSKEVPTKGPVRDDTSPIMGGQAHPGEPGSLLTQQSPTPLLENRPGIPIAERITPAQTNSMQMNARGEPVVNQLPSTELHDTRPAPAANSPSWGNKQLSKIPPKEGEIPLPEPGGPELRAHGPVQTIGFKAPLADMLEWRSAIGEMVGGASSETEQKIASSMYEAINRDIDRVMQRNGAMPDWNNYNTESTKAYYAKGLLSKIAGEGNELQDPMVGGKAVERIWKTMQSDSKEISILREQVPAAVDEMAAAYLRKNGPKGFQLPEGKGGLPKATKEALVPNPWERMVLERGAPVKPGSGRDWQHSITSGTGAFLGETAGNAINAQLGSPEHPLVNPATLGVIGAVIPPTVRTAVHAWENPFSARVPLQGALSGASASPLLAEPTERKKRKE